MRFVQIPLDPLEFGFGRDELPVGFGKAFKHLVTTTRAKVLSPDVVAFGFISASEWARRPRLRCQFQRRLPQCFSLRFDVLQRRGRME